MWPVTDASLDRLVGISTPGDRAQYFAAKPEQPPRGAARKREREQTARRVLDHRRRRPVRMQRFRRKHAVPMMLVEPVREFHHEFARRRAATGFARVTGYHCR